MTKNGCIEKLNTDIDWNSSVTRIYAQIRDIVTKYQSDNNVLDYIFPDVLAVETTKEDLSRLIDDIIITIS